MNISWYIPPDSPDSSHTFEQAGLMFNNNIVMVGGMLTVLMVAHYLCNSIEVELYDANELKEIKDIISYNIRVPSGGLIECEVVDGVQHTLFKGTIKRK